MVYDGLAEYEVAICSYSLQMIYLANHMVLMGQIYAFAICQQIWMNLISRIYFAILGVYLVFASIETGPQVKAKDSVCGWLLCIYQMLLDAKLLKQYMFYCRIRKFVDKCSAEEAIRQRHGYIVGKNVLSVQLKREYRWENSKNRPPEWSIQPSKGLKYSLWIHCCCLKISYQDKVLRGFNFLM